MKEQLVRTCAQDRRDEGPSASRSTYPCDDGLLVDVFRNILDVDEAIWDAALTQEDIFMSRDFVAVCQLSAIAEAEYWHLVVWSGETPVGVATIHQMFVNLDLLTVGAIRYLAQVAKSCSPNFLRLQLLICGLPVSIGKPCCRVLPGGKGAQVMQAVASTMEQIAASRADPLLCFKEFPAVSMSVTDCLFERGYCRAWSLPTCRVDLPWKTMDAYLAGMRSGYRRQVIQSIQSGARAGLEIRWHEDFADQITSFYQLYCQTVNRAAHRLETANKAFFEQLNMRLGDRTKLISIERNGRLLAAAILVLSGQVATLLFVGIAYEDVSPEWQVYPNLLIELVAESIRNEASYLEFGQTSYASKGRLGGRPVESILYFRHRHPAMQSLLKHCGKLLFPSTDVRPRRVFKESVKSATAGVQDILGSAKSC